MSVRHRVYVALRGVDPTASYAYETFETPGHVSFVFEDARSAQIVKTMLAQIFKRKTLIQKGRKPR